MSQIAHKTQRSETLSDPVEENKLSAIFEKAKTITIKGLFPVLMFTFGLFILSLRLAGWSLILGLPLIVVGAVFFVFAYNRVFGKALGAIALFLVFGGGGTVLAANSAVPGDLLYPIDRLSEKIGLIMTGQPEAQAELELRHSGERLKEAEKIMLDIGRVNDIKQTMSDYQIHLHVSNALKEEAQRQGRNTVRLEGFTEKLLFEQKMRLENIMSLAPESTKQMIQVTINANERLRIVNSLAGREAIHGPGSLLDGLDDYFNTTTGQPGGEASMGSGVEDITDDPTTNEASQDKSKKGP